MVIKEDSSEENHCIDHHDFEYSHYLKNFMDNTKNRVERAKKYIFKSTVLIIIVGGILSILRLNSFTVMDYVTSTIIIISRLLNKILKILSTQKNPEKK